MSNYIQPDYRNPSTPGVTVQVENISNPLVITAPIAKYTQAGTSAPAAPIAGQLANTPLGKSKKTFADGSSAST